MWDDAIEPRYLLAINIRHAILPDGRTAVDQLWLKDLQLHRLYLKDLELASPLRAGEVVTGEYPIEDEPGYGQLTHAAMPDSRNEPISILHAPRTLWKMWQAVGRASIVHAGVGGWPYPLGWPAALFARLRGKFLVVVVESAPWRLGFEPQAKWVNRVRGHVYERMARWSVNAADVSFFTQAEYKASLLRNGREGHVVHASWIDEDVILGDDQAQAVWDQKRQEPVRFLFAGRITAVKGSHVLIEAIRQLSAAGTAVRIDVMGSDDGDAMAAFRALISTLTGPTEVQIRPPVPYDERFFAALREYHALLVPSLADEQPRIIYDAFSQAVPVIASDTAGIRDCVQPDVTGVLVPPGEVASLIQAMTAMLQAPDQLARMGRAGLAVARRMTHAEMHRIRHAILRRKMAERGAGTVSES